MQFTAYASLFANGGPSDSLDCATRQEAEREARRIARVLLSIEGPRCNARTAYWSVQEQGKTLDSGRVGP